MNNAIVLHKDQKFSSNLFGLFEIKSPVIYNYSVLGIWINLLVSLIKVLLVLPVVNWLIVKTLFYYRNFPLALTTLYECIRFYAFVIELLSILLVLFDCLAMRSTLADAAGYLARMPLAFFSKLSSLNIHLVRLMSWTVILISMKFDVNNVFSGYKMIFSMAGTKKVDFVFLLQFFLGVGGFLSAICLYVALVVIVVLLKPLELEYELSHPWLENWESHIFPRKRETYGAFYAAVVVSNAAMFLFFLVAALTKLSAAMGDAWAEAFAERQALFYCALLLFAAAMQAVYFFVKNHNAVFLVTAYLWNMWFIVYLNALFVLDEGAVSREMRIQFYIIGISILAEIAVLCICCPLSVINSVLWFIKYITTLRIAVVVVGFSAIVLIIVSGVLSLNSINQELFTFDIVWAQILVEFGQFVLLLFDIVSAILSVISSIIRIVSVLLNGLICYVVILALFLAVLATVFIGFGAAIGPEIGQNISKGFQIVSKVVTLLRTMNTVVNTVTRFIAKARQIITQLTKGTGYMALFSLQMLLFLLIISLVPAVLAVTVFYFFAVERGSGDRLGKVRFFGLALLLALMNGLVFAAMDFLLSLEIDLLLLRVSFRKGWKLVWMELSYAVLGAGLLMLLLYFAVAPGEDYNVVDESDLSAVDRTYRFPGIIYCLCPLMDSVPNDTPGNTNLLVLCCTRILPRDEMRTNDEFEKTSVYGSYKRICCPCFYHPEEDGWMELPIDKEDHTFNVKRICACKKAYKIERKMWAKRDDTARTEMDILDEERVKLSYAVPQTGGFEKSKKSFLSSIKTVFNPFKFRLFPTFLITISVAALGGYFIYKSVTNDWITFRTFGSDAFSNVMNDRSNEVGEGDANQSSSERKFFCPLTDLVILILVFFGGTVLKFLAPFLAPFIGLIKAVKTILNMLKNLPNFNVITTAAKIIICFPLILLVALFIAGAVVLSLTDVVSRLELVYAAVLCLVWFEALSFIPEMITEMLNSIPFLRFDAKTAIGFYYAISAQKTLIFAVALMVVDHFAPIIPPRRTEEATELGERRARGDLFGWRFPSSQRGATNAGEGAMRTTAPDFADLGG